MKTQRNSFRTLFIPMLVAATFTVGCDVDEDEGPTYEAPAAEDTELRSGSVGRYGVWGNGAAAAVRNNGGTVGNNHFPITGGIIVENMSPRAVEVLTGLGFTVVADQTEWLHGPPVCPGPHPKCNKDDPDPEPDPDPVCDPAIDNNYGPEYIGADQTPHDGVRVLYLGVDTGSRQHPQYGGRLLACKNMTNAKGGKDNGCWGTKHPHGGHTIGTMIMGAACGLEGVAPLGNAIACKGLSDSGSGSLFNLLACQEWGYQWFLDWNASHPPEEQFDVLVSNNSWGGGGFNSAAQNTFNTLASLGVSMMCSAGNSGDGSDATNNVGYPARYAGCWAIAASDKFGNATPWSSDGEQVLFTCPGSLIWSTRLADGHMLMSGTSMASPHCAGAVGALRGATGADIACAEEAFVMTSEQAVANNGPIWDRHYGWGIINLPAAIAYIEGGGC